MRAKISHGLSCSDRSTCEVSVTRRRLRRISAGVGAPADPAASDDTAEASPLAAAAGASSGEHSGAALDEEGAAGAGAGAAMLCPSGLHIGAPDAGFAALSPLVFAGPVGELGCTSGAFGA